MDLQPIRPGKNTRLLAGKSDVGRLPETEQRSNRVDRIDSSCVAVLVKEAVARDFERITQAELAMAVTIPTFEIVIPILNAATAIERLFREPLPQAGESGNEFERGTRGKCVDCAI